MKCRICGNEMKIVCEMKNSALEVSKLYNKVTKFNGTSLKLYNCPCCNHYQIPYVNDEGYYDDYVMAVSHTDKIKELQTNQVERLNELSSEHDNFLEIGCGDGAFLERTKKYFNNQIGFEPSSEFCEMCKEKKLKVVNEYFTGKTNVNCKFDAFACRQVFEHIDNPVEILKNIFNVCNHGAVGLIEVPNGQEMISEDRYYDLFSDHINYYTPLSLAYLSKLAGFEVIKIRQSFSNDYLELYLRKGKQNQNLLTKRTNDIQFILEQIQKFHNVSIWGAGAKSQAMMTACGSKLHINHVFDTDKYKQGKYLINCDKKIEYPNMEKINSNDLIIIFAVSYEDEIMRMLRDDFKYKGYILSLEGKAKIINI